MVSRRFNLIGGLFLLVLLLLVLGGPSPVIAADSSSIERIELKDSQIL